MKSILFSLAAILSLNFAAHAQQKTSDKAVISTPTLLCEDCKERLEKVMFREPGVTAYKVDLKKKTVTVTWLTDRTNIENIKTDIANAGYDADDVEAEETAYKRLPACCKKVVVEKKAP